jgi:DNA-binding response OmpR family regulator
VAARVLVVEDAPEYAQLVTAALRAEHYEVMTATTLSDARDRMRSTPPDLVILDLTLPDGDGLDLCQEIRQNSDAFVIVLTGRDDEVDKLVGFRLGADDYVTKPFSPRELAARVGALLARTRGSASAARSTSQHVGDLTIDTETRYVTVEGNVVELTKIEFDLLNALTDRPGSVLTRSQLLMAVWGDNYIGDDHVVDVHIANLRKKIDTGKPSRVRTVRGVGYAINH